MFLYDGGTLVADGVTRRTYIDKVLRDRVFQIACDQSYQRESSLTSTFHKLLNKKKKHISESKITQS